MKLFARKNYEPLAMEIRMRILALTILLLSTQLTHAASDKTTSHWILSHAEFVALKPQAQQKYIAELRQVLSEAAEKSDFFANQQQPKQQLRSIATENTYSAAELVTKLEQVKEWRGEIPKSIGAYNSGTHYEGHKNALNWLIAARISFNELDSKSPASERRRLEDLLLEEEYYFNSNKETFAKKFRDKDGLDPFFTKLAQAKAKKLNSESEDAFDDEHPLVDFQSKAPVRSNASSTSAKKTTATPAASSQPKKLVPVPPPPPPGSAADNADKSDNDDNEETTPENIFRCLYAGFIIKKDPCTGPKKLPDEIKITPLNSKNMSCEDHSEVVESAKNLYRRARSLETSKYTLCNPFIYGVKSHSCTDLNKELSRAQLTTCLEEAKPHCVLVGQNASAKCDQQSNSKESLAITAELIKLNPKTWQSYKDDLNSLCSQKEKVFNTFKATANQNQKIESEKAVADIAHTCAIVRDRLTLIASKYRGIAFEVPADDNTRAAPAPEAEAPKGKK
jgi:hypothetical protein